MVLDRIKAKGHNNILCTHGSTIELTKDRHLTKRGNCILGVSASKACYDLTNELKLYIKEGKKVQVILESNQYRDSFYGYGDKNLSLNHQKDIVFRKSDYICNRTGLVRCSKSSRELSRELINNLKTSKNQIHILFKRVEENGES
ncbi:MAG: DUF371 domain-containing protein [Promethearchaeota archaeon]|nr:MAG: DUF371 domain-containing protein [Candidatus Lokiarchaeota archaeon]